MSFLSLGIHHCSKIYEKIYGLRCASEKELKILEAGYVSVVFTDNVLDPTKQTSPFSPVGKILISRFTNGT